MVAGQLEILLFAGMARLQKDMNEAKGIMAGAQRDIENIAGNIKKTLGAIGVGVSIGAFAKMIKDSIDFADSLNDLSKATSLSIETLSGLAVAAKQSGSDLNSTAASINKLAMGMGKDAEKFAALGVTAKEPLEAFKQLADVFKNIQDPQLRAAAMAEALGRSWAGAAPLLAEGGKRIGEMVAEGTKASGVTAEMARMADELNDKWTLLAGSGGMLNSLTRELLPILLQVVDGLAALKNNTGEANPLLTALVEAFRALVVLGGNVAFVLNGVATEAKGIATQLVALAHLDLKGFAEIGIKMKEDAEAGRAAFDKWEAGVMAAGNAAVVAATQVKTLTEEELEAARIAEAAAKAFLAAEATKAAAAAAAKKAAAEAAAEAKRQQAALANLNSAMAQHVAAIERSRNGEEDLTDAQKFALKVMTDLQSGTLKLTEAQKIELAQKLELLLVLDKEEQLRKRILELHAHANALRTEAQQDEVEEINASKALVKSIEDEVKGLRNEAATLHMTDTARKLYLLNKERQLALDKALDADKSDLNAMYDEAAALIKNNALIREQMGSWDELSTKAGDFFADLVMNGKSAVDNLKRYLRDLLTQMIALFAKRWILNMVAGGTMMGAAGSALAGGTDGTSLAGTALSAFGGSLGIGGAGLGASMWGAATSAGVTATETGVVLSTGTMAGTSVGTGVMGSVYTALASIPVWGWIAMAVIAAIAFFSGRGGGPKVEGSFGMSFGRSGEETGPYHVSDEYGDRFFRRTGESGPLDEALARPVRELNTLYGRTLDLLGGTRPGTVGFALGVSNDPRGDAPSMLGSDVTVNGVSILRRIREMDDKEVGPEMQLEVRRMLLAALQASDLPDGVAQIINSLNVETATAEAIDAAINLARAYQNLGLTIEALEGGPVVALQQRLDGMRTAVEQAGRALDDAIETRDPQAMLSAEQQLEQAIMARYNAEMEMIAGLRQAIRALEDSAYQFAMNIAARINAVGGSRDIAGMALARAGVLRGRVGGTQNVGFQLEDVQGYVGAIDTWYNTRRDAIMRDAEQQAAAQAAAAQAVAAAQSAAAQARVAQLQKELELANAFKGVVDKAKEMLEEMRYTTLNPAPLSARTSLHQTDLEALRAAYASSTGMDRAEAANNLLDALREQLGMLGEMFQRPSNEYLAGYNAIVAEITGVQGDAMSQAERVEALTAAIAQASQQTNVGVARTATAAEIAQSALQSLDAEALSHYEWAEAEAARLYEIQRTEHQTLLDTITGGMDPDAYIARETHNIVVELQGIRTELREGLTKPPEVTVNVDVTPIPGGGGVDVTTDVLVNGVKRNATVIKRILASA